MKKTILLILLGMALFALTSCQSYEEMKQERAYYNQNPDNY